MLYDRLKPFLSLIVPVAIAAAGFAVAKFLTLESVEFKGPTGWDPTVIANAETAARWWVATTTILLLAGAVGALSGAWYILHKDADTVPYRQDAIGVFAVLAIVGILFVGVGLAPAYADLGGKIFAETIGIYPKPSAPPDSPPNLGGLKAITRLADIATICAAVAIAVAAAVLIEPAPPVPSGKPPLVDREAVEGGARKLFDKIRHLKLLLFLAAMALVLSLVQAEAWRLWPTAFWAANDIPPEYQAAVRATVSFRAALYVAVLAAIFLPTAIRLRDAGRHLANIHSGLADEAARKRWLSDTGLALSFGEQAKRFLAIVTPFLAAAATALFDKLVTLWPTLFPAALS